MPKTLPTNADDMFCHAIYATWHVVNRAYKKHLSRLDLTYPQYITLTLLWEQDRRNVSDIAASLSMETNTLTPLLKRMESRGLVNRKRCAQDERQIVISLTGDGRALKAEAVAITSCMVADTELTAAKLDRLVRDLNLLRSGLANTLK